jgi:hypothetical protein
MTTEEQKTEKLFIMCTSVGYISTLLATSFDTGGMPLMPALIITICMHLCTERSMQFSNYVIDTND